MASVHDYSYEEGVAFVPPELNEEETLEYLIKAFSRELVECQIDKDTPIDCIKESRCVFSVDGIPSNVKEFIDLEPRIRNPLFMSRVLHLASHVRYTKFNAHIAVQDEPTRSVLWWLEDLRSETTYLKNRNLDTLTFRKRIVHLMESLKTLSSVTPLDLSLLYAASCGRRHNGVFSKEESSRFALDFEQKLGVEHLAKLDSLLERYLQIPDDSDGVDAALIAKEWVSINGTILSPCMNLDCMDESSVSHLVMDGADSDFETSPASDSDAPMDEDKSPEDELQEETPESEDQEEQEEQEDTSSDEMKDVGSSKTSDTAKDFQEENPIEDLLDEMEPDASDELQEETPIPPSFDPERYKQKEDEDKAKLATQQIAKKVFPKEVMKYRTRPATAEDNALASNLINTFRKAQWRAPTKITKTSMTPPGKLMSRAAVSMAAQKRMGLPTTAEPFRQTIRKRTENPPPIIGMACDISGSMMNSEKPMAQIVWACSRAVPRVGGKFAAVSFGKAVKSLIAPGEKPAQVPILKANQSYEMAFEAISALAGGLNLLSRQNGVKVLILSTDGEWHTDQKQNSIELLKRLEKNGVHVFWITFQGVNNDRYMKKHFSKNSLIPQFAVGSILEFEKTSEVPMELGKVIARQIAKG